MSAEISHHVYAGNGKYVETFLSDGKSVKITELVNTSCPVLDGFADACNVLHCFLSDGKYLRTLIKNTSMYGRVVETIATLTELANYRIVV